ncbi:phosphoribosyltransferase family protein [Bacillus sp. FJAT-29814]|uniref:phosphoribosyltransferase family protein n=1 Tax=Bacillus sp. FJAT-29814 TaxID=1729688 RepID=UPI001561828C|nr:phosphoribosyltransferase family protein [Bacillus sp. FJAT-29814]
MKNSQTLTLLKKKSTFRILDAIEAEIEVLENPYGLPMEELFTMAARINKKRSFLFVSKVLGKHLPIHPNKGLLTAALLAARYFESVKGGEVTERERLIRSFLQDEPDQVGPIIPGVINPVVIGFAETATALGHAFFDCFHQADFFHTTREEIHSHAPEVTFEEEHSHATSHRCYIPLEMIQNDREIILVDDEMTTGKTALNIIQSIHASFPRTDYTVVSILDWRSEANRQEFSRLEEELGITIHTVSLLAGNVHIKQLKEIKDHSETDDTNEQGELKLGAISLSPLFHTTSFISENPLNQVPFIKETGRFGLNSSENKMLHQQVWEAANILKSRRTGGRTLCLGTGEFMYLPMKIASAMGSGVFYQSTTRSPIYIENREGYGARYGISFPNPEDLQISHNVYNIPPGGYDEIFLFFEREPEAATLEPLLNELKKLQFNSVKLVFFSN